MTAARNRRAAARVFAGPGVVTEAIREKANRANLACLRLRIRLRKESEGIDDLEEWRGERAERTKRLFAVSQELECQLKRVEAAQSAFLRRAKWATEERVMSDFEALAKWCDEQYAPIAEVIPLREASK